MAEGQRRKLEKARGSSPEEAVEKVGGGREEVGEGDLGHGWPSTGLLGAFDFPIFTDFPDFLGRLRPRQTRLQKPPITLGVEESSSPRRVLHF